MTVLLVEPASSGWGRNCSLKIRVDVTFSATGVLVASVWRLVLKPNDEHFKVVSGSET